MPFFRPRPRRPAGAPPTTSRPPIRAVTRRLLDSALACGSSALPNEFGGILRSDEPGVITDLLLLPGTTAGHRHANFQLYMLPVDLSVVGTVHSHPSGALHPSDADVTLFRHWGRRHLILGRPFTQGCWRAYDHGGEEIHLDVVEGSGRIARPAVATYVPRSLHRPEPAPPPLPSDEE
jgi:proteasome lid subunit RPN8/RPN11